MEKEYELTFIIPLYGENCFTTSAKMAMSLALLKTTKKVRFLFFHDDTVPTEAIDQILQLFKLHRQPTVEVVTCFVNNPRSGYKRNRGIDICTSDSKLIWFIDQDDMLLFEDLDPVINTALEMLIDGNKPLIKVPFQSLDITFATTNINTVITMPWQYIFNVDLVKDYKFDETTEMGSDVPFVIKIIEDYLKDEKTDEIPSFVSPMYFYNYLYWDSESYRYFIIEQHQTTDHLVEEMRKG